MIDFTDVVKSYTQGNKALNGVTMQIEDGEFCFLIGPSGSGKSTIIKLITGELKPTSGTVHVNGYSLERIRKREVPYLRRTVGVVFQDYRLIEKMTVYENVAFAMRVVGAKESEIKERVPYVLELVGLESKMNRHPNEMSGGEQQRLAIARALVNNPSTIIASLPAIWTRSAPLKSWRCCRRSTIWEPPCWWSPTTRIWQSCSINAPLPSMRASW